VVPGLPRIVRGRDVGLRGDRTPWTAWAVPGRRSGPTPLPASGARTRVWRGIAVHRSRDTVVGGSRACRGHGSVMQDRAPRQAGRTDRLRVEDQFVLTTSVAKVHVIPTRETIRRSRWSHAGQTAAMLTVPSVGMVTGTLFVHKDSRSFHRTTALSATGARRVRPAPASQVDGGQTAASERFVVRHALAPRHLPTPVLRVGSLPRTHRETLQAAGCVDRGHPRASRVCCIVPRFVMACRASAPKEPPGRRR